MLGRKILNQRIKRNVFYLIYGLGSNDLLSISHFHNLLYETAITHPPIENTFKCTLYKLARHVEFCNRNSPDYAIFS